MLPSVETALIAGIAAVFSSLITATFLLRGKKIDWSQDLLKQTREELHTQRNEAASLRKEIDEERKARHTLEDDLQEVKKTMAVQGLDIVKLNDEKRTIQQEYEATITQMHEEHLGLLNKIKALQQENEELKTRIAELEAASGITLRK